jgi:7-keto-8-aminopelargonate synthetase-like enzyme
VLKFAHRDAGALAAAAVRCGSQSRVIVLTDGMFSHDGSVAPLRAYLKVLPRDSRVLVDDAHGAGTLGDHGRGAVELEGVDRGRIIQCVTLSKAFGIYGGVVLGSRALRRRIMQRSHQFIGSTPLPLPLVAGALAAVKLMRDAGGQRRRLQANTAQIREALVSAGWTIPVTPGPIIALPSLNKVRTRHCARALLAARILPPLLRYPGGPPEGYFRFVPSSEHSQEQIESLVRVLSTFRPRD